MRLHRSLSLLALIVALPGVAAGAADGPEISAEEILSEYVVDFRLDPTAAGPITFGVSISGEGGGEKEDGLRTTSRPRESC